MSQPVNYNDLPDTFGGQRKPYLYLTEAVGTVADETTVTTIAIVATDRHGASPAPLVPRADGLPVLSCERWVRLRIVATIAVSTLQVTLPNYEPHAGWALRVGTTRTWRPPSTATSPFATLPPPLTTPGLLLDAYQDQFGWTSEWLVMQASWSSTEGDNPQLQDDPLQFTFDWNYS